jgi:ribulose-phosphate 3-epimerase
VVSAGRGFIAEMGQKVRRIREMTDLPIGADDGITAETAPLVVEVGAQVLAGGSAVYKGDPASEIRKIIEAGRRAARRWQTAHYREVHPK